MFPGHALCCQRSDRLIHAVFTVPRRFPSGLFSPLFFFCPSLLFSLLSSLHINHQVCVHNIIARRHTAAWRRQREQRPFEGDTERQTPWLITKYSDLPFLHLIPHLHLIVGSDVLFNYFTTHYRIRTHKLRNYGRNYHAFKYLYLFVTIITNF